MASLQDRVLLPCGLVLPNRLVKSAMLEPFSGNNHIPDEQFKKLYSAWGKGEWGMILTGNVQVDPRHLGSPIDLCVDSAKISDPEYRQAWKEYAQACAPGPVVMQINHPGRQTMAGAGTRGFTEKALAPSAVALKIGTGLLERGLSVLLFGTLKAMSIPEIELVIRQFTEAAKLAYDTGFDGVELHGAHGYLLAQFMSAKTNLRDDEFGGTAHKRVEIVIRIIKSIREATSPTFAIGMKINSVDAAQSGDTNEAFVEQVQRIVDAGIDFLEVSGGTYENADVRSFILNVAREIDKSKQMAATPSERTASREAFFLEFAALIRQNFPSTILMVTGGFRSLEFMRNAVVGNKLDLIGLGRPAILNPYIPRELLSGDVDPGKKFDAPEIRAPFPWNWIPIKIVGIGFQNLTTLLFYEGMVPEQNEGVGSLDTFLIGSTVSIRARDMDMDYSTSALLLVIH
ncbi:hypothetical protein BOTCAL_0008g00150 [Botryotinia calthae]|uniref:NADH:flavin oxidoreductase/NADH oxidase N-terminal domain-containing protein n=1 Tax=Botryotinia calthae TaxID=38488 RepID=A0A4Y8DIX3_9HELO|nr:hypothetical protein BOTCAL_0008g00150 [Botryotinia calthae]